MELRQLTYLVAVVEEGSFSRAAERIHVAQPAISRQIAQLERELGERLLSRSRHRIEPTAAGHAFLVHAQAALAALADGRSAVADLHASLSGRLTIGSVQAPPALLIAALASFKRRHQLVEVMFRIANVEALTSDVAVGRLDVAVIGSGDPAPPRPGLEQTPLSSEPLVAAVGLEHPLAAHRTIPLAVLRDYPLVTLPHGSGLRTLLKRACAAKGFQPRIEAESDDVVLLAELAAAGLGVAVMPRSLAERAEHVRILRVREPELRRHVSLAINASGASVTGRAFYRHVQRALAAA